jgi:hypothetical protein
MHDLGIGDPRLVLPSTRLLEHVCLQGEWIASGSSRVSPHISSYPERRLFSVSPNMFDAG